MHKADLLAGQYDPAAANDMAKDNGEQKSCSLAQSTNSLPIQ